MLLLRNDSYFSVICVTSNSYLHHSAFSNILKWFSNSVITSIKGLLLTTISCDFWIMKLSRLESLSLACRNWLHDFQSTSNIQDGCFSQHKISKNLTLSTFFSSPTAHVALAYLLSFHCRSVCNRYMNSIDYINKSITTEQLCSYCFP